jgi:hypothetical protein
MKVTANENRLLWALRDMVEQHLDKHAGNNLLDSGFIRSNRTAMEILVEYGHMELVSADDHGGRWYQAAMVPIERTPNSFGKDVEGNNPEEAEKQFREGPKP